MIENRLMTADGRETAKLYWSNHLSGELPRVALPGQKPQSSAYTRAEFRLNVPELLAGRLTRIAKQNDLSMFAVLLAAGKAWISRLTGQEDIPVTVPVYSLSLPESEASNRRLVVRDRLRPEQSFRDTLSQVKMTLSECYRHQLFPLRQIEEELGYPGGKGLWSAIAFAMENLHLAEHIGALTDGAHEAAFVIGKREGELSVAVRYNGDIFHEEAIRSYVEGYLYATEQLLDHPDRAISEVRLTTEEQWSRIVHSFNDTKAPYSSDCTVHELFERQAAANPDHAAVIAGGSTSTYREMNDRANKLAALLRQTGIGPGSYVAVLTDRSVEMITAVLAILKAGGAYVPLDPGYPRARIETILTSLPIRCIVTKASVMRPFQELTRKLPNLADVVYMDVPTERPGPEQVQEQRVRALWDRITEESFDWVTAGGFISSYDGQPFGEAEVAEYRDRVVSLARAAIGPDSSVLEIGCGSGLISFELAPLVAKYVGLDPSEKMLERNRATAEELGLQGTEWISGFAHDLEGREESSYDLIVLASTAQFFPGYAYLEHIVELALRCLKPGGTLLLADIMDLRKKDDFRESLEAYKELHGTESRTRSVPDYELYCDEDFFYDLQADYAQIGEVGVLHRTEGFRNELGYRYDVVVKKAERVGEDAAAPEKARAKRKKIWTAYHIDRQPAKAIVSGAVPDNEAYVIFTSGSTGTPKGVVVRHKPVINVIEWVNRHHGVGAEDVLLFLTPLCFDLSVYDIFGTLAAGGTIRIASDDEAKDPERLLAILRSEPVTIWDSAPAALQQLVPYLRMSSAPSAAPGRSRGLRLVMLSGDWIPLTLPADMKEHFEGVQVTSLGGATEATVWSNFYPVEELDPEWVSIPYGKPIQNARYYILDSRNEPCPTYVPGELYIGGECLASGYTNAALTAERFIADPFAGDENARMYRTGDLAKWLPDGTMIFLGRADNQVKIRGFRIELGEVEAQLLKHAAMKEALVVDRTDRNGHKSLCAYFTADRELPIDELKKHAVASLPAYMVPSHFVRLEAMPVTSNGKIDRKKLPSPQEAAVASDGPAAALSTPQEERLAAIWREVLDIGEVGAEDDFFDLGGDSLQAVQVVAKANEARIKLSLRDMLHYRTLRAIAEHGGGEETAEAGTNVELAADQVAAAASPAISRRYNTGFTEPDLKIPYYYPCYMGAISAKLTYEHSYRIPRSFLPFGDGLGVISYGFPGDGGPESRLQYTDVSYIAGFRLGERFGVTSALVSFDTMEEGLEWCEAKLQAGELIVMTGTTYYLNYCKDYLIGEETFTEMLKNREAMDNGLGGEGQHSHMFVLVDHSDKGYVLYDTSFNFFGTISESDLKRSFAGVRGLSFLQNDPGIKFKNAGNAVIDVRLDGFVPVSIEQLGMELLERYAEVCTGIRPPDEPIGDTKGFLGLEGIKAAIRTFSECGDGEAAVLFSLVLFNNWKYKHIFLRDFLQDLSKLVAMDSLSGLLREAENAIALMGGWHERTEAKKELYAQPGNPEFSAFRSSVVQQLTEMHAKQEEAFRRVLEELNKRREEAV